MKKQVIMSLPIAPAQLFEQANPTAQLLSIGCGTIDYQFRTTQEAKKAKKAYFKRLNDEIAIGIAHTD